MPLASGQCNLSPDGLHSRDADETRCQIEEHWRYASGTQRYQCDFAQLVKKFGNETTEGQRRYSPATIIGIDKKVVCGNPRESQITTSHSERQHLTCRMQVWRMTRLTNAHSKKWECDEAMLALYYVWYNWCRRHSTIKTTPAVAAGLAKEQWSIKRMLREVA